MAYVLRWACPFFSSKRFGFFQLEEVIFFVVGGRNKLEGVIFFVTGGNADVAKKYGLTVLMLTIRNDSSKVLMLTIPS